ncbi:glycoside hydrolase GH127 family [Butyrivibrio hungatei]|uniref:Glycoside hydrolase GH127 family n=2 Tax=Butyrivibrio hungatei TaxID=185008 RepID=A0A1D9NYP9_9FIRM|nr:glycoside hydrolase GH127 family [Butyrivibrio hungatei]
MKIENAILNLSKGQLNTGKHMKNTDSVKGEVTMVKNISKPINLRKVHIDDPFWKSEMELVRNEVIPYQWKAINDEVEGAEPSYAMRNFKVAGKITARRKELGAAYKEVIWPTDVFRPVPEEGKELEDKFYGFLFQDTDFSKWIEAVGYSLTQHPDPELEKTADEAIDIVCAAQQENGYLDTYYIINDMSKIFTHLKDHHELYCLGHLTEGAVAYYEATGKDKLLNAARRFADYVYSRFGTEEGKIHGFPGHEISEMALVRLYEVTGDPKYLELSKYFIDARGQRPYYFDIEHPDEAKKHGDKEWYHYYQAHKPVREQDEAVGHAVRAVYLYSGMADVARLTGDEELYAACERLWDSAVNKKMYITGGIGSTNIGEAFTYNYDLPNDLAYTESCASVGLVFFARRMLQMNVDSKYANAMERALYNTVLAGMALDGKSFFYVNPLEVRPEACYRDERKNHVKPVRQKWFPCACCPPNIARLLSSVAAYAYTESDDTLFMHLYVGGTVEKEYENASVLWKIESDVLGSGKLRIVCEDVEEKAGADKEETIAVRVPDWCDSYDLNAGGCKHELKKGYEYITGVFKKGDVIEITFAKKVRIMEASSRVFEDHGKVAVTYGPFVYCIEEKDNGKDLHMVSVTTDAAKAKFEKTIIEGNEITKILLPGKREKEKAESLYSVYKEPEYEDVTLELIPYYTWANRGEGEMRVWINR